MLHFKSFLQNFQVCRISYCKSNKHVHVLKLRLDEPIKIGKGTDMGEEREKKIEYFLPYCYLILPLDVECFGTIFDTLHTYM